MNEGLNKEKRLLLIFLKWIDKQIKKDPMKLETDNDDVVEMFLKNEQHSIIKFGGKMKLINETVDKVIKGVLNGEEVSEQWEGINNAILIAQKYAEEMCKKQREVCKESISKMDISKLYLTPQELITIEDVILNSPLATEEL